MGIRTGEIYLAALPNQAKARPAIVLTADWLSQYALDVSVIPLTSVLRANFPARVELQGRRGRTAGAKLAKCDQVTTIPESLLVGSPFGRLRAARMQAIEAR